MTKIIYFIGGYLLGYFAKTVVDEHQSGGRLKDLPPYMRYNHRKRDTTSEPGEGRGSGPKDIS